MGKSSGLFLQPYKNDSFIIWPVASFGRNSLSGGGAGTVDGSGRWPETGARDHIANGRNEPPVHSRAAAWHAPLMGELAIEKGLIARPALERLLTLQRRWGGRLGEIMVGTGAARSGDIARLLSAQRRLPFIDLAAEPADFSLTREDMLGFCIAARCLPWRRIEGETVYVAADPDAARATIVTHEGRPCRIFIACARAIDRAIEARFREELNERACFELKRTRRESSASTPVTRNQLYFIGISAALLLIAFACAPAAAALAVNIALGLCFLAVAAIKCLSIYMGLLCAPTREETAFDHARELPDVCLPVYTVMVPLFHEAAIVPLLADALSRLDYPASKLDIKLIFEETDHETHEAARALDLPGNFELVRVPHSLPLTKPKACNFALPFARGEYLVVYDAEDMPEPDQLRRAVAAFELGDDRLACVQAQLNYFNWFENWLTRQFALEYAAFFDLLLPTLVKLGMPIPLGGTSTHFRTRLLREAGAWDPFNVTEDADLGMRFALLGLRSGIIRSTTQEEANCRLGNWLRQRSRWIKGWIQTYLVRMRHPVQLYRTLGLRGFLGFQLIIGGFPLSNFIHPLFYLSVLVTLATSGSLAAFEHNAALALFDLLVLATGYGVTIIAGMTAAAARGLRPLVFDALMMPAYWLLISAGACKALAEFVIRPFHWQKTHHGLSRLTGTQLVRLRMAKNISSPALETEPF